MFKQFKIYDIKKYKNSTSFYTSGNLNGKTYTDVFKIKNKYFADELKNISKNIDPLIYTLAELNLKIRYRKELNIDNDKLKNLMIETFNKMPKDRFEIVNCFNSESVLCNNTKVLIIGSITSISGIKNGYFYTSNTNQTMLLLDGVLKSINKKPVFLDIKNTLIDAVNNNQNSSGIIKKLKDKLINNNIAFLDVIECCIRPKNSSLDEDITISLPYSSKKFYLQVKDSKLKAIFTNSNFVEKYFNKNLNSEKILDELNIDYYKLMSPSPAFMKKVEVKQCDWINKISNYLK